MLKEQIGAAIKQLRKDLSAYNVDVQHKDLELTFSCGLNKFSLAFYFEKDPPLNAVNVLPLDFLLAGSEKVAALAVTKLQLNKRVFARNCEVLAVKKAEAVQFLDKFHFLHSTGSAYNLGLFRNSELLAIASFSKGRKMRRLKEHERSFELIRFCSRPGYTITGGLSRLVKTFCVLKNAAEVMTYVDKQFSDGVSFKKAGFKKIEESEVRPFLVNRENFQRKLWDGEEFNNEKFYLTFNKGNIKMIYEYKK